MGGGLVHSEGGAAVTNTPTRTTSTMEQEERGVPISRATRAIPGDASGALTVPAIEQAAADLRQSWAGFDAALAAIRPCITEARARALDNAAVQLEAGARLLAVAHLLAGATSLLHGEIGTFSVPSRDGAAEPPAEAEPPTARVG
jgi:hypothetical protein